MFVTKIGNKVYGGDFTAAEKRAIAIEIQKELAEFNRNNMFEVDAIVLWILHDQYGFGPERLKRFYKEFNRYLEELINRYELETTDRIWICTKLLKDYGIDLEEWDKDTYEKS